ncbi:MAG TPA: L,D-transpeptidase family protein [Rubricoccaceae bacterium]|nr:L,D-transpeptidase family protein [Rubricoccaceae bacterium]
MSTRLVLLLLALAASLPVRAQTLAAVPGGEAASSASARPAEPDTAPVYYAVRNAARVHVRPDSTSASASRLAFREGVRVLEEEGGWSLIQQGRVRGYVRSDALSNVWLRVDKSDRLVYVYRGAELIRTFPADVSTSDEDKERRSRLGERDHYRIPEGVYFICRKNARSQYYRAFVLNYPNQEDGARGLRNGLITAEEYAEIVKADLFFQEPPMGTALGGLIEIHGSGSGRQRRWTRGCVALRNVHMDELWEIVEVGTPVVIEP